MYKTLIMTVGIPRCGKSTWAQSQNIPIVCPDAIRLAFHGQDFIPTAEPAIWMMARYMVKALFHAGHDRVILDATNTLKKNREDWKSDEWKRSFKEFPINGEVLKTCLKRAEETEFPKEVVERMYAEYEPVEAEERDINF